MKKRVELPLVEPMYSTYHYQGPATAIIVNNPSIRNWYLNEIMNLACNRKFLNCYTTPELNVDYSSWRANPYIDKRWISTEFAKGYINPIIREFIDRGFYVAFVAVDDYYIKGKSWYKERHFGHDGLICGYDQNNKTYCIYAYDSDWVYRKFWITQKDFNAGIASMRKVGEFSSIYGIKAKKSVVEFCPKTALQGIKKYLDSNLEKYPFDDEGDVYGIVVHQYLSEYLTKLYLGDIPYERMDSRIFRLIWEHKKVMLERIEKIEETLKINNDISEKYKSVVSEANVIRVLYASHHMKRRDSILPTIKNKLLKMMQQEKELLTLLLERAGDVLENETLELS